MRAHHVWYHGRCVQGALLSPRFIKRDTREGLITMMPCLVDTLYFLWCQPSRVCGPRSQNAPFRHDIIFGLGSWK